MEADIDEKLKEATTGMESSTHIGVMGKTSARILFGEADGGKSYRKTRERRDSKRND